MLFGDKHSFAIEAHVEEDLRIPSPVWGRMCIWTEGMMIGRIDKTHCSLYPSAKRLAEIVEDFPSLWADELEGMRDEEIFQRFDSLLYTGPLDVFVECEREARFWKFDFLTHWGEHMEDHKGCVVHHPEGEVVMVIELLDGSLICRRVDPDLFVHVAKGYLDWFWKESARLRPES